MLIEQVFCRIDGIPALVDVEYTAGLPAFTPRGEYAPIDPPEPPGVEILAIYDVKGYPARWLERKYRSLADEEKEQLEIDLIERIGYD